MRKVNEHQRQLLCENINRAILLKSFTWKTFDNNSVGDTVRIFYRIAREVTVH